MLLKHHLIIALVRPYVWAELPLWGKLYEWFVKCDKHWESAPTLRAINKYHGYERDFDLSKWPDRLTFFLGRWYDLPAQLMIKALAPKLVIDVGANRGEFTLAAAATAERVISFEPNPSVAAILKADLFHNGIRNVTLHEVGLGDRDESLTLHVPDYNTGSASFGGFEARGEKIGNIPVRIGDEILEGENPDLIKIDVEGFETRAIRGMRRMIEAAKPVIITEVVDDHLKRCGSSIQELIQLMSSLGYTGHGIGTHRSGRTHKLVLGVKSHDIVWLPSGRSTQEFRATTADLKNC